MDKATRTYFEDILTEKMRKVSDKYEIRHRALIEAINFCGGVAAFSNRIKVSRSRASNWLNRSEINIPYEYVVLTEDVTGVHIERLSPFTESANKAIRRLRSSSVYKSPSKTLDLNEIIIDSYQHYLNYKEDRPIIIGTDRVLIAGLSQFKALKLIKMKRIIVTVLDLESTLLEIKPIRDPNCSFLISEQIAIGLRLEKLIGKNQSKISDFYSCRCRDLNMIELCRKCDEVKINFEKIAYIVGMNNKNDYFLARQVYLHGHSEIINKLDRKETDIPTAVEFLKIQNDFQANHQLMEN